jgi:drug/metabolite transporter (DMT)-like permease
LDRRALPFVVLLGMVWGSNLVVARFGLAQFSPLPFVGLRLFLASLLHVAIYAVDRQRSWPRQRQLWLHAILLGTMGTAVPMTSFVAALQYLSSGMASIFVTSAPAITVLMAHFLLADESLNRQKVLGIGFALGGASILAFSGESGLPNVGQANPLGVGLILLGIIAASVTVIYTRRYMVGYDAFDVASARMVVATLVVNGLVLATTGYDLSRVDGRGAAALVYTAIFGAFVGLWLEFWIIQRFGATSSAMTAYVIPIVATVGGALVLEEQITLLMAVGMVLIISGIAILNWRRRVPREQARLPVP